MSLLLLLNQGGSPPATTLYYIVVASGSTAPTAAQVVAGVSYTGGTVLASGSVDYTAAGTYDADSFPVTGLSAGTVYDQWWVAYDGSNYGDPLSGAITTVATVAPTGIASAETFGTASFARLAGTDVSPTGVASAEAFGTPTLARASVNALSPTGIASVEAFGTAVFGRISEQSIVVPGIASAEAFGTASVTRRAGVQCTGIVSGEAFGYPVFTRDGAAVAGLRYARLHLGIGIRI